MRKYFIEKLKSLRQLFVSGRFMIAYGKKGFGNSYGWHNRHLVKHRD